MKLAKKVWYIFDRKQKVRLLELLILLLIGTALETVGVTAIIPFISAIMYPQQILDNEYAKWAYNILNLQSEIQFIIVLSVALILIYIIKNFYLCFMYSAQYRFVFNNQKRMGKKLLSAYMQEPYAFHLQHNSAELLHNINADVDLFFSTVQSCITLITDVMICLALATVSLITDPTITLGVAALLVIFIALFYKKFQKKNNQTGKLWRAYSAKSKQTIQQAFGGIKEIKVLGREEYFVNLYDVQYGRVAEARRKVAVYTVIPKPLMETVCIVALLGIVSIKILNGVDMEYFIPTLSVFALTIIRMLPSSSRITGNMNNIVFGKSSIDAVYHDLKEVEEWIIQRKEYENTQETISFEREIEIKNLSFKYANTDKYVLKDMNMKIAKNSSIALVGPSGSGKTTLADIVLGVLQAEQGEVLVDGINVWKNMRGWQSRLGYIPQNIYITDDTIRRNIAFALDDDKIDDDKIWKALEEAQLKEFVESLEEGLDTIIGEHGARISGGQRQRIGIARALYHNPEVLVLDEATSALDGETETAVMEAIHALNGRKTLIIIAHRLSTIEKCDYVYRVENGQVLLERGNME